MENTKYNLENEVDQGSLSEELKSSDYFNPQVDVTYKFKLLDTTINKIEKESPEGEKYSKYEINVEVKDKSGVIYTGIWECTKAVMSAIMKSYVDNEGNMNFTLRKTGSGKDTRYSVTEDY